MNDSATVFGEFSWNAMNDKVFLLFRFPEEKDKLAKLPLDQKLEWYAHQIQMAANAGTTAQQLLSPEFAEFWKWRVLIPLKIKRFYYRVKSGEIWKKYPHITEIKKSLKKGNAHLI